MTPRRFNIYIRPLSWNTRKNKLELNAEIIARNKDISRCMKFSFVQEGLLWLKVLSDIAI